jgi:nucleotide-binding universal stress UspA family protein
MQPVLRILVPVDFSSVSKKALAYAERLIAGTGAELVLLHAFELPATFTRADIQNPADPKIRKQFEDLPLVSQDVKVERVLHAGPPGAVICWMAENRSCDLIVMGTHGHTGVKHLLLGSVAEYVVRHARCPVLTVSEKPADQPPLPEPLVTPVKAPRFM